MLTNKAEHGIIISEMEKETTSEGGTNNGNKKTGRSYLQSIQGR